jgi:hypothetical protein
MRSKYLLGLVISSGLAVLATASGCGGDSSNATSGSGGSGNASSSVSSTTGVGPATSSTGMAVEDPNTSCDTAEEIIIGDPSPVGLTLDPIDKDEDYYVFTGTKGQVLTFITDAKPTSDEFDTTYPDLVMTLYRKVNGQWVQFAENDDPTPPSSNDSALNTILPASEGDQNQYCVRITECNVWAGQPGVCAPSADILNYEYAIGVAEIDPMLKSIAAEVEPNNEAATATAIEYDKNAQGNYYLSLQWGFVDPETDVDVWSFTVPMDAKVEAGRATCYFDFLTGGDTGNGSTLSTGLIASVTTAADPATTLAEADILAGKEAASISMPCNFGENYLLFIKRPANATKGENDFYFTYHNGGGSNPLEAEAMVGGMQGTNETAATAEALEAVQDGAETSFFVEGDIKTATDLDYFSVDVPAGTSTVRVSCSGQRLGSGVRGLSATVYKADGTTMLTGGSGTETAASSIDISQKPVGSETKLVIKLAATSLDANVKGTGYRCGVHLAPPG